MRAMKTLSTSAPGAHCLLGGLKVESGVDSNKNLLLDASEVTNTAYLCTLI